ncbi:MAG: hypothetical protein WCI41_03075 [bacterium]
MRKKKEADLLLSPFITYILFLLFYLLYIFVFKIRNKTIIIGKENLPKRSHGVFTFSNHDTFIDSLPIRGSMLNYFDIIFRQNLVPYDTPEFLNFYKTWFGAFLITHLRNIPIIRKVKRSIKKESKLIKFFKKIPVVRGIILKNIVKKSYKVEQSIDYLEEKNKFVLKCCEVLKKNNLNIFFGGGRDDEDGSINQCTSGTAEIILKSIQENVGVIFQPIFINGMKKIMPRSIGQKYWKIKCNNTVTIIIGKPIKFDDLVVLEATDERKIHLIKIRVRESVINLQP